MCRLHAVLMLAETMLFFALKTLYDTVILFCDANRRMLALVLSIQRFHPFFLAKLFTVISDHKPLRTIKCKLMNTVPARLQCMF